MSDEKYQNISIALLVLTALVLILGQKQGDKLPLAGLAALVLLLALALMAPFAGFLLAVPVALVAWFDNQAAVWAWWEKIKGKNLNLGGEQVK